MKILKTILRISLVASLVFLTISSVAANTMDRAGVESFMDKVINARINELNIPGATVSVVANGEVVLSKGYGYADLGEQIEVNGEHTLFRIGSVSKLFTWTAVMQLVEQGMLDVNADVNDYLDFEIAPRIQKGPYKTQTASPITLTHLMTHTAGFEDVKEGLFSLDGAEMLSLNEYIRNHLPARVYLPGEVIAYSNYGAALAGYIVQQVSGIPYAQYIEQNIYTPLGMNYSTFRQPVPQELSLGLARASKFVDGDYIEDSFIFVLEPAGSMSSSATDMARFMIAHLQEGNVNGELILKTETSRQMHSQQFSHHQSLDGMAFGFVEQIINGHRVIYHGGSVFVFNSGFYLLPEENIGIFISYSGGTYNEPPELFQRFMDEYYPAPYSLTKEQTAGARDRASKFLGEYHPSQRSFSTSESLLSLMEAIHLDINEDGYIQANFLGETSQFVESEPGIYYSLREGRGPSPYGGFRTLVFETDALGRTMLYTDGIMSYSKAPWYGTSMFMAITLAVVLTILIVSLIAWVIAFFIKLCRRKRPKQPKIAAAAHFTAITFSIITLGLLIGLSVSMDIHPLYGVPEPVLGVEAAWSGLLELLPVVMLFVGLILVIFTMLAWWKGFWRTSIRIHYTVFTIAALILLWIFNYWNFL